MKPVWHDKLTLIEYTDPVEGGVEGIDNKPHIELAQNSAYLKQQLDNLETKTDTLEETLEEQETKLDETAKAINGGIIDEDGDVTLKSLLERIKELESNANKIPVGTLVASKIHYETGGDFAQAMGYGVWERALEGRVPVGFSDIVSDPEVFRTAGAEYGDSEVTLQEKNIPPHSHEQILANETTPVSYVWNTGVGEAGKQAHLDNKDSKGSAVTTGSWGGENGETQPFSTQPPSRTIDWWERVA